MLSQFSCNGTKFKLFSIVFNVQPLKVYLLLDFNFERKFYYLEKHKNTHGKFIFHFGYLYFVCFVRFFLSSSSSVHGESTYNYLFLYTDNRNHIFSCYIQRFVPFLGIDPILPSIFSVRAVIVKEDIVSFRHSFLFFRPNVTVGKY